MTIQRLKNKFFFASDLKSYSDTSITRIVGLMGAQSRKVICSFSNEFPNRNFHLYSPVQCLTFRLFPLLWFREDEEHFMNRPCSVHIQHIRKLSKIFCLVSGTKSCLFPLPNTSLRSCLSTVFETSSVQFSEWDKPVQVEGHHYFSENWHGA
jgi:hypothetical protein